MRKAPRAKSGRAQRNSKNSHKRISRQVRIPERRVPGGRRIDNIATAGPFAANFLNYRPQTIKVSVIDDGSFLDNTKYNQDHTQDALVNLYNCLKRHPNFKDDKNWEKLPSPMELKRYLFEKMHQVAPKGSRPSYNYDDDGRLRLLFLKYLDKLEGAYMLPIEWVPELQEKNGELYELATAILGMIADRWRLDVITNQYNGYIIDEPEEHFEDYENSPEIKNDVEAYRKGGVAYQYKQVLRKYSTKYSRKRLQELIDAFNPSTAFEKKVKRWLELGVIALENPRSIGYYFFPDLIGRDEEPVKVDDMYNFCWSFHGIVFEHSEDYLNNTAGNFGVCPPAVCSEFFPDKKPSIDDGEEELEKLAKFMLAGRNIYFAHYSKHFEKLHKDPEYKSHLIEILAA